MMLYRWMSRQAKRSTSMPAQIESATPPSDGARVSERAAIVEKARKSTLLDGVFSILLYNRFRSRLGPPPYAAPVEVGEVYPEYADAELIEACTRASNLLNSAYEVGDRLIATHFKNSGEVRAELAATHPGFSDRSYEETINYGCFQAR